MTTRMQNQTKQKHNQKLKKNVDVASAQGLYYLIISISKLPLNKYFTLRKNIVLAIQKTSRPFPTHFQRDSSAYPPYLERLGPQ